jgi:large subunit ribosomal protein L35
MQKTRKSIAKKFKITGSGKVIRRTPGKRHFLRNKTATQKNNAGKDKVCPSGIVRYVKVALPGQF